jgi:hypothetical protein
MDHEDIKKNGKTWFIDIDGVIFEHNGYLKSNVDAEKPLPGITDLFRKIADADVVVLVTARKSSYKEKTIRSLYTNKIRFDYLIMDLPTGARYLINDTKPDGTNTAFAFNLSRDVGTNSLLTDKIFKD